jgi:nuclear pore complex protein Nup107
MISERSLHDLIASPWLISCRSTSYRRDEDEIRQLDMLREMYLPEVLFQLHTVLYTTRDHVPSHRQQSLQLCRWVVDERFPCYRELMKCGKLSYFLELLRYSSLAMLEVSRSPFASIDTASSSSSSSS